MRLAVGSLVLAAVVCASLILLVDAAPGGGGGGGKPPMGGGYEKPPTGGGYGKPPMGGGYEKPPMGGGYDKGHGYGGYSYCPKPTPPPFECIPPNKLCCKELHKATEAARAKVISLIKTLLSSSTCASNVNDRLYDLANGIIEWALLLEDQGTECGEGIVIECDKCASYKKSKEDAMEEVMEEVAAAFEALTSDSKCEAGLTKFGEHVLSQCSASVIEIHVCPKFVFGIDSCEDAKKALGITEKALWEAIEKLGEAITKKGHSKVAVTMGSTPKPPCLKELIGAYAKAIINQFFARYEEKVECACKKCDDKDDHHKDDKCDDHHDDDECAPPKCDESSEQCIPVVKESCDQIAKRVEKARADVIDQIKELLSGSTCASNINDRLYKLANSIIAWALALEDQGSQCGNGIVIECEKCASFKKSKDDYLAEVMEEVADAFAKLSEDDDTCTSGLLKFGESVLGQCKASVIEIHACPGFVFGVDSCEDARKELTKKEKELIEAIKALGKFIVHNKKSSGGKGCKGTASAAEFKKLIGAYAKAIVNKFFAKFLEKKFCSCKDDCHKPDEDCIPIVKESCADIAKRVEAARADVIAQIKLLLSGSTCASNIDERLYKLANAIIAWALALEDQGSQCGIGIVVECDKCASYKKSKEDYMEEVMEEVAAAFEALTSDSKCQAGLTKFGEAILNQCSAHLIEIRVCPKFVFEVDSCHDAREALEDKEKALWAAIKALGAAVTKKEGKGHSKVAYDSHHDDHDDNDDDDHHAVSKPPCLKTLILGYAKAIVDKAFAEFLVNKFCRCKEECSSSSSSTGGHCDSSTAVVSSTCAPSSTAVESSTCSPSSTAASSSTCTPSSTAVSSSTCAPSSSAASSSTCDSSSAASSSTCAPSSSAASSSTCDTSTGPIKCYPFCPAPLIQCPNDKTRCRFHLAECLFPTCGDESECSSSTGGHAAAAAAPESPAVDSPPTSGEAGQSAVVVSASVDGINSAPSSSEPASQFVLSALGFVALVTMIRL